MSTISNIRIYEAISPSSRFGTQYPDIARVQHLSVLNQKYVIEAIPSLASRESDLRLRVRMYIALSLFKTYSATKMAFSVSNLL